MTKNDNAVNRELKKNDQLGERRQTQMTLRLPVNC